MVLVTATRSTWCDLCCDCDWSAGPVPGPAAGEERSNGEVVGAVGCIGDGFIVRDVVYE